MFLRDVLKTATRSLWNLDNPEYHARVFENCLNCFWMKSNAWYVFTVECLLRLRLFINSDVFVWPFPRKTMFSSLRWWVICRKDLPCRFSKMYFCDIFEKSLVRYLDLTTFWKCTSRLYFSISVVTLKILVSCRNSKTGLLVINKIVLIAFFHYYPWFLSDFVSCSFKRIYHV